MTLICNNIYKIYKKAKVNEKITVTSEKAEYYDVFVDM